MRVMIAEALLGALLAAAPVVAQNQNPDWDSGVSHFNNKEYRQAIVDFQNVVDAKPDFANTYYYLGMAHYFLKEYGKAASDLGRYISYTEKEGRTPKTNARVALGRAYINLEDYTNAAAALAKATQTASDDPTAFYYLGWSYQNLKQTDKAVEALNAGLKLFPKDADMLSLETQILLARALVSKAPGDFQAAIARGEQLRLARDDDESATLLANAYLASGDFAKASVHYARVVAARATDGPSWYNYGLSLSRSKQFAKAETALEKAATIVPDNAGVWTELGYVEESLGNYPKAYDAYQKAYAINPDPSVKDAVDRTKDVPAQAPPQQDAAPAPKPSAKPAAKKPAARPAGKRRP